MRTKFSAIPKPWVRLHEGRRAEPPKARIRCSPSTSGGLHDVAQPASLPLAITCLAWPTTSCCGCSSLDPSRASPTMSPGLVTHSCHVMSMLVHQKLCDTFVLPFVSIAFVMLEEQRMSDSRGVWYSQFTALACTCQTVAQHQGTLRWRCHLAPQTGFCRWVLVWKSPEWGSALGTIRSGEPLFTTVE